MKAVLVMDMPKSCFDCPLCYDNCGCSVKEIEWNWEECDAKRADGCPLKPLPEKLKIPEEQIKEGKRYVLKEDKRFILWTYGLDPFLGELAVTSIYVSPEKFEEIKNSKDWHTRIFENREGAQKALDDLRK